MNFMPVMSWVAVKTPCKMTTVLRFCWFIMVRQSATLLTGFSTDNPIGQSVPATPLVESK